MRIIFTKFILFNNRDHQGQENQKLFDTLAGGENFVIEILFIVFLVGFDVLILFSNVINYF
jgi:hypothetical protein